MKNSIKKIAYQLPVFLQVVLHKIQHRLNQKGDMIYVVNQLVEANIPAEKQKDVEYINSLKKDVFHCFVKYLAKPSEYFLLGFECKNEEERNEMLTDVVKDIYCCKYANIEKQREVSDKFLFYERMKPYFKREACIVRGKSDRKSFIEFTEKHHRFIAKPNGGSFGQNTNIFNAAEIRAEKLFEQLIADGTKWIIEELIVQSTEMAKFNPTSVNSVRIPTFRTKLGIVIEGAFMRAGRKDSVVDNAGAGGVFVKIDENTGEIISDGYTETGERYKLHPDSLVLFRGFQIPQWKELVKLAKACHEALPDHKYVGWDFALTANGWVLMEGNWGQFLCQQVSGQRAYKKRFIELIKD